MQIEIINSFVNGALCENWFKERVGSIQRFYFLKTQHVDFKSRKKACVLARQSVRNYIIFALLILDNVQKRLDKLNPLSVSLAQVGLAFEIFQ